MSLLRKLFVDDLGQASQTAQYERQWSRGKADAPKACNQMCGFDRATKQRTACTSTVRNGVCPCRNC